MTVRNVQEHCCLLPPRLDTGLIALMQLLCYVSSANRAHENYLCQGGTEERQTKQLDMAEKIVYHPGTPILSARR